MEQIRNPSKIEKSVIAFLLKRAKVKLPEYLVEELLVSSMRDGNMGSLYLFPVGTIGKKRTFGSCISEWEFKDDDGIKVLVSLYLDTEGNLFELDVWKTDFGSLLRYPSISGDFNLQQPL